MSGYLYVDIAPARCRRCDWDTHGKLEAQCNECREAEQRRAFCLCGHTLVMHHNGLGCLATMAGELCDCDCYDGRPQPQPVALALV